MKRIYFTEETDYRSNDSNIEFYKTLEEAIHESCFRWASMCKEDKQLTLLKVCYFDVAKEQLEEYSDDLISLIYKTGYNNFIIYS